MYIVKTIGFVSAMTAKLLFGTKRRLGSTGCQQDRETLTSLPPLSQFDFKSTVHMLPGVEDSPLQEAMPYQRTEPGKYYQEFTQSSLLLYLPTIWTEYPNTLQSSPYDTEMELALQPELCHFIESASGQI